MFKRCAAARTQQLGMASLCLQVSYKSLIGDQYLDYTPSLEQFGNLEREPMVFCYADVWPVNFLMVQDGNITVVDFKDASILPVSFPHVPLKCLVDQILRNITDNVKVPEATANKASALKAFNETIKVRGFASLGSRLFGSSRLPYAPPPGSELLRD